jgi:hypothetical protein
MATLNFTKVRKAVENLEQEKKEKQEIEDWKKFKNEKSIIDFEDEDDKSKFWLHKESRWNLPPKKTHHSVWHKKLRCEEKFKMKRF